MRPVSKKRGVVLSLLALAAACAAQPVPAEDGREARRTPLVRAVEKVSPAVVNISTEFRVENPFADSLDPFEWFFGGGSRRAPRSFIKNSLGSGVIVDPEGILLTNNHVIAEASRITVTLQDRHQVEAEVIGADRDSDLAVLRLKEKGPWPFAQMGKSDDLMIGETVIALGNPFGLENTVTVGVVSAVGRTLGGEEEGVSFADFIQTDAAINPGNSGGALVNILGELIGINAQIVAQGQNLGFAIPIDRARVIYNEIARYGRVRPVWTGMVVGDLEARQAEGLGLARGAGVFVFRRFSDSPAAAAQVQSGDLIIEVGGQKITKMSEYETAMARFTVGSSVPIQILRDGKTLPAVLTLSAFPQERAPRLSLDLIGFNVTEQQGAVFIDEVKPDSPAAEIGLRPGMRVLDLNGTVVEKTADFYSGLADSLYRRSVLVGIATRGARGRVPLPLGRR